MKLRRWIQPTKPLPGFTLIEAAVTATILVILSVVIASFIFSAFQAWVVTSNKESTLNLGRNSLNRMVTEIKGINKPQNIITAIATYCAFNDINSQTVSYTASGNQLLRNGSPLITNLSGINFTYLDSSGNSTAVINNIRSIRVRLTMQPGGTSPITLESSARIRNL